LVTPAGAGFEGDIARTDEAARSDAAVVAIHITDPVNDSLSIPEHVLRVLREAKRPMRVMDIVSRLEELGVKTTAKKGLMPNVSTAMKRRPDLFARKGRGVYGLKEWLITQSEEGHGREGE